MRSRPVSIIKPPTFYLDTSAVRHLVEQPSNAHLRRRVEQLVTESRLLVCTSYVTVEELITSCKAVEDRRAAISFVRRLTPHGLHGSFDAIVRQWVVGGAVMLRANPKLLSWNSIDAKLQKIIEAPPQRLLESRDASRRRATRFREGIERYLHESGYPGKRQMRGRHWETPANLYREAIYLTKRVFCSRTRYAALWRPLVNDPSRPVSEVLAWESRKNPWVVLYVRLGVFGVARRMLTGTQEQRLMNDYYDSLHVVCCSAADGIVTDDEKLAQAIQNLRRDEVPKVWTLRSWPAEIDRVS